MNCGLLLTSGDRLLLTSGDALTLTSVCDETPAPEEARFGGSPHSVRDLQDTWEERLERLLREDEELLCLL